MNFLDFEQPIAELEAKIEELRHVPASGGISLSEEIEKLQEKSRARTESIFADLNPWQTTQVARHPMRPYTLDYIEHMFSGFEELHGDRMYADDPSVVCGLAWLDERALVVIGHQKGRDTNQRQQRNFGMPLPEGYRKARRLMEMAGKFGLPIVTLVDTPGAYPGIGAEERGQSEAIARNIYLMAELRTPVVPIVIGEGGSGGALAIGVGDHVMMLEYAVYSVISPEGCASILWKSAEHAPQAAEAMGITSKSLLRHGLVDEVVPEPLGGAHRDPPRAAANLRTALVAALDRLAAESPEALLEKRYERLRTCGHTA